jgi:hypothetical protein
MTTLGTLLTRLSALLGQVLPVLVSMGVLYFIWGVVMYFIADDEEAKTKGKDRILYGVIGLAVIISLWGLVNLLADTLDDGLRGTNAPSVSTLVTQSSATACGTLVKTFPGILNYFTCIIAQSVIPALFAVAMVTFIWGSIKFFIIEADEEAKREQGKQFMLWGIIALAVMISVWGLVGVLADTFGFPHSVLPSVTPNAGGGGGGGGLNEPLCDEINGC